MIYDQLTIILEFVPIYLKLLFNFFLLKFQINKYIIVLIISKF
jgi:hypothetical protein